MSSFFEKSNTQERNLGYFSSYEIEDIYDFIGQKAIMAKLEELKNMPTMGIAFEDFITQQITFSSKGPLSIFGMILENYFEGNLELSLFLYNKSEEYNLNNYYSGKRLSKMRNEYIESIYMMLNQPTEDKEYWKSKLESNYWIEYHFFYQQLIKLWRQSHKKGLVAKLPFNGSYIVEKKKIKKSDLAIEIKTRKKPLSGQYLSYKDEIQNIKAWFDLQPVLGFENEFFFMVEETKYNVRIDASIVEIERITGLTEFNSKPTPDLSQKIENLIENYTSSFELISERMYLEFRQPVRNRFSWDAIQFYRNDENKVNEMTHLVNRYPEIWNHI